MANQAWTKPLFLLSLKKSVDTKQSRKSKPGNRPFAFKPLILLGQTDYKHASCRFPASVFSWACNVTLQVRFKPFPCRYCAYLWRDNFKPWRVSAGELCERIGMQLKTERVVVTSREKEPITVEADLLKCPKCGNESFYVFQLVGTDHLHLQCTDCTETFCNSKGACAAAGKQN